MRLKKFIKKKLYNFFGLDQIIESKVQGETKQTKREFYNAKRELDDAIYNYKQAKKIVDDIVQVGVDIDLYDPNSNWAVICIGGNTDYVRFIDMRGDNIRDISSFLRKFEATSLKVDAPYNLKKEAFTKIGRYI